MTGLPWKPFSWVDSTKNRWSQFVSEKLVSCLIYYDIQIIIIRIHYSWWKKCQILMLSGCNIFKVKFLLFRTVSHSIASLSLFDLRCQIMNRNLKSSYSFGFQDRFSFLGMKLHKSSMGSHIIRLERLDLSFIFTILKRDSRRKYLFEGEL